MKYLIWDFNGTIVDDVKLGVNCINQLITKYLKRPPLKIGEYQDIFTFPVKDYYEKVGFDFSTLDFKKLGNEWIELYDEGFKEVTVFDDVVALLNEARNKGYRNVVISASKEDKLKSEMAYLNLTSYFEEILGINDIYATSKLAIAQKWAEDKKGELIFLGDSLHDEEVASSIGARCYLISRGHQSKKVLQKGQSTIIDNLKGVSL